MGGFPRGGWRMSLLRRAAWCSLVLYCVFVLLRPAGVQAGQWVVRTEEAGVLLYGVAYGEGLFVAVGENGFILTSPDGVTWTWRDSGVNTSLGGVTYGNGRFVAVGQEGTVVTSPDGITWTSGSLGIGLPLAAVTYGNGRYVAVGYNTVATSTDGASWSYKRVDFYGPCYDIVYGSGRFVAACDGGIYLSSDGLTWAQKSAGVSLGVVYGNGRFVVTGPDRLVWSSTDGETWTSRTSGVSGDFWGIAFGNGKYVAVGVDGVIATSTDGETWTERRSGTGRWLWHVAYGDGQFVAVGEMNTIVSATDGWTRRASGTDLNLYSVTAGDGRYVALGPRGTILTSADGAAWSSQTPGFDRMLLDVVYGDRYVAVGSFGAVASSPDGQTWTLQNSGTGLELYGVGYGNGQYIAVGEGGTILSSPDGATWTERAVGTMPTLDDVAYGGGRFVAVGWDVVATSPDGVTWTSQTSGTGSYFYDVVYGGGQFVAVGSEGTILTSPDGVTWTRRESGTREDLKGVTFGGGQFVAVGGSSNGFDSTVVILTSPDGVTWTPQVSGPGMMLLGVAYGDGQFVAVGDHGAIFTAATDADLAGLTVSAGSLVPAFDAGTTEYTVDGILRNDVAVTATLDDVNADLAINGATQDSGVPRTVALAAGENTIRVAVTSQAGTTKTYTITVQAAPDGSGTLSVPVSGVPAGSTGHTLAFTYTTAGGMDDGALAIDVPEGWSPPSTSPGDPGYTTAGVGTVAVSGRTITVTGLTLAPGEAVTVTYGDKSGGGPGAAAPTAAGAQTWQARSRVTGDGTLVALSGPPVITVEPGEAARLAFSVQPGGGTGGTAWSSQPVVVVQDVYGNTVSAGTHAVALAIAPGTGAPGATLSCDANPVQAVGGVARFSGCRIDKAGPGYELVASSGALMDTSSLDFDIATGPAAAFTVTASAQETVAGEPLDVTVTAKDAGGNTVTGYEGTVRFGSSDSRAVLPAEYAFEAGYGGTGTFQVTLRTAGEQTVTVTDAADAGIAGTSGPIAVRPAAPAAVTVTAHPASVVADGATRSTVTARVTDAYGNDAADGTPVTFAVTGATAALTRTEGATAGGVVTTEVYAAAAGTVTVTAAVYGTSVSGSVSITFTRRFTGSSGASSPPTTPGATTSGDINPAAGGTVQNSAGTIRLEIPAGAIEGVSGGPVRISVTDITGAEAKKILQTARAPEGIRAIGRVFEFKAETGGGTSVTRFAKPVTFTVALSPADLAGVTDPERVGLFRLNEDGTLTFIGGRLVDGKLVVQLHGFSRYLLAEVNVAFPDLAGHWAQDDVELMASKYVVKGLPDGRFHPEGRVTRAEFTALLVRALGLPPAGGGAAAGGSAAGGAAAGGSAAAGGAAAGGGAAVGGAAAGGGGAASFSDVRPGDWFYGELAAAVRAGLVQGYGDGTFRPDTPVTREQVAVLVARALAAAGKAGALSAGEAERRLAGFADRGAVSPWAREGLALAVREGIVRGQAGGVLAPQAGATRAEAAVMVARFWRKP